MGHELDGDTSPIEAGMVGMTSKNKEFIGKSAMLERAAKGAKSGIVTLILDDETATPLGHEPIYQDRKIIGHTTSAAFGYRIGKPIALGYVHIDNPDGQVVELDIARKMYSGRLVLGPAFDPNGTRMRQTRQVLSIPGSSGQ